MGQESQASSWVEAWNSACLSRCPRGERPLVELYLEPGVFSERCTEKLPLRVDCIHRREFGEVSGHRVLIKRGPGNRGPSNVEAPTRPRLECRRETGLILRCDRKVGNPFQTKQGSRPSCPDQEGRKGSEEGVPENLSVPLEGDRDFGELCGSHQGCQVPFRPPIPNVGLLLRRCSGKGLHLAMTGEPRGFSRVTAGFSSYDGEFRMPLVLAQASPIFHSSCEGKLGIALE